MSLANADEAAETHREVKAGREAEKEAFREQNDTRSALEGGPEPDDDAPATADGGVAEATSGYTMSVDRRVGSTGITIEHGTDDGDLAESEIQFGNPSGRTTSRMLAPIESMDDEDATIDALGEYVWATLGNWAIDEQFDADFFADRTTFETSMTAVRKLATGGLNPEV